MIGVGAIRMVRAPLDDADAGVNARLLVLPLDGTDARPAPLVAIIDPTADDTAVTQQGIPDYPIAVVTCEQPAALSVAGVKGSVLDVPSLLVSIAYVTRDTVQAADAWRDSQYTLLAIAQCLEAGLFASAAAPARVRGNLELVKRNGMQLVPVSYNVPGGKVTGALVLDLYFRYTLP